VHNKVPYRKVKGWINVCWIQIGFSMCALLTWYCLCILEMSLIDFFLSLQSVSTLWLVNTREEPCGTQAKRMTCSNFDNDSKILLWFFFFNYFIKWLKNFFNENHFIFSVPCLLGQQQYWHRILTILCGTVTFPGLFLLLQHHLVKRSVIRLKIKQLAQGIICNII
jgi:hypothetical protein